MGGPLHGATKNHIVKRVARPAADEDDGEDADEDDGEDDGDDDEDLDDVDC